jgi:hypothetical protein
MGGPPEDALAVMLGVIENGVLTARELSLALRV